MNRTKQNKKEDDNILVLWSEVMPYTMAGYKLLINTYDVKIHLVRYDTKNLTPYIAGEEDNLYFYPKSKFNYVELLCLYQKLNPRLIYVAGRMEKDYLRLCIKAKKDNRIVVGMGDGQFRHRIQDYLKLLFPRLFLHRYFDYFMVPGMRQYHFAKLLRFKENQIIVGCYFADLMRFQNALNFSMSNRNTFTILFVGRVIEIKGIPLLIESVKDLISEGYNIQIKIIGNGSCIPSPLPDWICHIPFSDQTTLVEEAKTSTIFCLPSTYEPWGVVVHEFAALGLPLLVSEAVGAGGNFVRNNYNGFIFKTGDKHDLKEKIVQLYNLPINELIKYSERGKLLSLQITPEMWVSQIANLANISLKQC